MSRYFLLICFLLPLLGKAQLPALIPFNDHGKWGYSDSNGVIKIQPAWSLVSFFYPNGMAWVEIEKKIYNKRKIVGIDILRGIIDTQGNYIIEPKYALADQKITPETHYFYFYYAEGFYMLYDNIGKFICSNCVKGDSFFRLNRMVHYSYKRHQYGLKDLNGKWRSKRYDGLYLEETGDFSYYKYCKKIDLGEYHKIKKFNTNQPLWIGNKESRYYLIDSNGNEVYSWKPGGQKNFAPEYCETSPMIGVNFGGIKKRFAIQYPDTSELFFNGPTELHNCTTLYEIYSKDNFILNDEIQCQFRQSNFYLIDKYGREYTRK